jgi:N-succinyldiaminopimelate aminotransferase
VQPAATTIFTEMTVLAERTGAVNLGQGFPDEDGPAAIVDAAVVALRSGHNQYAPLPGVPDLRAAVAEHQRRRYGLDLDPATEVQVTFGATEAIAASLLALLGPGDEVLALDPAYDAYAPVAALAGGSLRPVALEPPDWRVEEAALARAVTSRTRVLLLNSPHNPTGRVLDRGELELLAGLCRAHDLVAVTDEVYEHLVYEGEHVPLATLPGMRDRTLTTSSLGKTHSLTGWKVGWATGPGELVARMRAVKQFLSFAGGTPLQQAAATGVALPDAEIAVLVDALRAKRDRLAAGLREVGFEPLPSAGTYFLNADARALDADAEALCRRLPHEAGVVAIPLSAFRVGASPPTPGATGQAPRGPRGVRPRTTSSIVRFAFCKRQEVLDEAIARLLTWSGARSS